MRSADHDLDRYLRGALSRRDFTRLAGLGLAAPAIAAMLASPQSLHAQTPKRGGRARLAFDQAGASDTLDPVLFTTSIDSARGMTIFNTLVNVSPELTPVPELAESWEPNGKGDEWTFRLRKGVTFHDGKSLTPADVVYSISRHLGEASKSPVKPMLSQITEIKAAGDSDVHVKLASPNADFPLYLTLRHTAIVQDGATQFDTAAGTGPFKVQSFEPGVRGTFVRNENYWKTGLPYLDGVETFGIDDTVARMNALLSGSADYIIQIDPRASEQIRTNPEVELVRTQSGAHWTVVMLRDTPPFDNLDAVLGVKYLLDRELILSNVLNGFGQIGNDHPIAPFDPFYCSDLPVRPFDPEKAKFHFKKAGIDRLSVPLQTSITIQGGLAPDTALLLQQAAAKAGITLEVENLPASGYWENIWMKTPFHMSSWNGRPTADLMFSSAYLPDAAWNESHWRRDDIGPLLTEARSTLDTAKRKQLYCEVQRKVHEDGGVGIPVFFDLIDAKRKSVKGVTPNPTGPMAGFRIAETMWLEG